jgi:lipopolysaccharide/colanic/teichoic acid biosynthesis glycosyltransferase
MGQQSSSVKYWPSLDLKRFSDLFSVKRIRAAAKRVFDVLVALIGLIVLLPLFAYVIHLIRRDSPGPAFYWGPRAGVGGKTFHMLKFRTMYECSDSYSGPRVTCKQDNRITPIGHWLRTTKINELPQLWNVLVGDMSLVGPRPEDVEIAATWPEDARQEILSMRPGVTSPASILYHDEEDQLSSSSLMNDYLKKILPDKMRLDRLYVRNHTFFADIDIVFWTIAILIPRMVRTRIPEGYLFAGPFSRLMHRYVSWFLLDLFVTFGSCITAVLLWRIQEPLDWGAENLIALSFLMAVMFSGINSLTGLKRIVWTDALAEDASGLILSAAFATAMTMSANYLQSVYHWLRFPALPITMIFTTGLMAGIGFIVVRYRWRLLTGFASRWLSLRYEQGIMERVLIVGSGEGTQVANWLLRHGEARQIFSIIGIVDNELLAMQGMQVKGLRILGGLNDIPALLKRYDIGVVLYAIPNGDVEAQEKVYELCVQADVRMIHLVDLLSTLQQQLTRPRDKILSTMSVEKRN